MKTLIAIFAFLLGAGGATAGEFRTLSTNEDEGRACNYRFEGQVTKGDAARLDSAKGSFSGLSVCLNSPGGSFSEGVSMFGSFWSKNLRATVLPGERCESACALAFLGGSVMQGSGQIQFLSREIFPGAKLGFHAPSMTVSQGRQYTANDVKTGFRIATAATGMINDIRLAEQDGVRVMSEYLFAKIISTPGDDMFYIDTVGRAALADITVLGVQMPSRLTDKHAKAVCDVGYLQSQVASYAQSTISLRLQDMRRDGAEVLKYGLTENPGSRTALVRTISTDYPGTTIVRGYPAPVRGAGEYLCVIDKFKVGSRAPSDSDLGYARVYADEAGYNVGFIPMPLSKPFASIRMTDVSRVQKVRVAPIAVYGPATRLSSLPLMAWVPNAKATTQKRQVTQTGSKAKVFKTLQNIDLVGADLTTSGYRPMSRTKCESTCRSMSACKAYTWVREKEWCFPKSGDLGRKPNSRTVSGVLQR